MSFCIDSETGVLRDVLLCRPEYFEWLATSDIARESISGQKGFSRGLALKQHATLVEALENANVKCHFLEPDDGLPDLCWTRDSSQITPWGAVITKLSDVSRRRENSVLEDYYHQQLQAVCQPHSTDRLEGGDIHIIQPGVLALGHSQNRTTEIGARKFASAFIEQGWKVHFESVGERFVHLDVVFCMVATTIALICLEAVSDEFVEFLESCKIELVDVHMKEVDLLACNCLALGDGKVIMGGKSFRAAEKLRVLGLEVIELDMNMFSLAGGGVHCLTQPLRRDPVR